MSNSPKKWKGCQRERAEEGKSSEGERAMMRMGESKRAGASGTESKS